MSSEKEIIEGIVRRMSQQPSQSELINKAIELGEQELIQIESLFQETMQQVSGFAFSKQSMYYDITAKIEEVLRQTKGLLHHSYTPEQINRMTYNEKQEAKEFQTLRMNYMNDLLVRQHKQN